MSNTVAVIISIIIAFAVTAGLGFVIIPWRDEFFNEMKGAL